MGNQIAVSLHTRPGEEILCAEWAHVRNYERGAASALSGVAFRVVPGEDGTILPEQIHTITEESGYHLPAVSLLVWENTHNVSGGTVVPREVMTEGTVAARDRGLAVHLDGARIFNAAAASGIGADRYAAEADTVMFCLSKGLGAPVGSMLCGTADAVERAREVRKRLGGGMRQAGVIAAAGRVALAERGRLAEDHAVASRLAAVLEEHFPGAVPVPPETNMVLLEGRKMPVSAEVFAAALAEAEVLVGFIKPGVLRFCTHRDVSGADVDRVAAVAAALS
jgi:threonine aldolase